jgi:hypothetical protein
MCTIENRRQYDLGGLRYSHDLIDEEWAEIKPLIPPAEAWATKAQSISVRSSTG